MSSSTISFFPVPYPDELFYSLIARYVYYTPKQCLFHKKDLLFDSVEVTPLLKFACNLEAFCQNIGYLYKPEEILQNNTVYPYFSPFITSQRQSNAFRSAKFKGNTFTSSIGAKMLGETRHRTRCCPLCCQEDRNQYGETYLHRSHHLDGIDICLKHSVGLIDYEEVSTYLSHFSYRYFNPELSNEISPRPAQDYEKKLAGIAGGLLELPFHQYNLDDILKMLRSLFIGEGLATRKVIHYDKVYERILQAFPEEFLAENHLLIHDLKRSCWIRNFFKRKTLASPLEGVILIALVSDSVNDFIVRAQKESGKEEVFPDFEICHNPFCQHYQKPEVRKVSVECNYKSAIYRCECGQIYRQFEDSPDHYSIVQLGELYGQEIHKLKESGLSDEKIAQKCNVSRKGIKKQLNRDGYSQVDEKVEFYQKQLLDEIEKNSEVSRKELNEKFKSAIFYLSKYCPEFYADLDVPTECYKFPDYDYKSPLSDDFYAEQIERVAQRLYDLRPEVLVSQQRIVENLRPAIGLSTAKRLEKSSQLLNSLSETRHDFTLRKIINRLTEILNQDPDFELSRENVKKILNLQNREMNLYWSEIVTFFTERLHYFTQ